MSMACVSLVWTVLSLVVAVSFWFSLLQPHWFVHSNSMTSLGVYSYCYRYSAVTTPAPPGGRQVTLASQRCRVYGDARFHFSKLPSVYWQATCVLVGSASVLASVCALAAVVTLCLPRHRDSTVAVVVGYVQIIAGQSLP